MGLKFLFIPLTLLCTFTSCIENNLIPDSKKESNDFLYLASFLETQRNYITGPFFPAVISAEVLNANLDNYLLIDIRPQSQYSEGHIPNSINLKSSELIDFLSDSELSLFTPIVIISLTGHKSAYVTTLLRLLGYTNVGWLNYGLGYWNQDYSKAWINAAGNSPNHLYHKNNNEGAKVSSLSNFPVSKFDDDDLPLETKVEKRIRKLLNERVDEFEISIEEFEGYFDRKKRIYNGCQIIFFGELKMFNNVYNYYVNIRHFGAYEGLFSVSNSFTLRPDGSQRFDEESIHISSNLLALPTNKRIFVYSVDGQESAAVTAYLNLLGYEAKSIRFGMYGMYSKYFYDMSITGYIKWANEDIKKESVDTVLTPTPIIGNIFNVADVKDYSIVSGN